MILFIVSELFFFLRIFWCYIHIYLSPAIQIGQLWPPKNILIFDPYHIPLLNTVILLSSGVSITWCHHAIINYKNKKNKFYGLLITVILGIIFTYFQYEEYHSSSFAIWDRVYGSIFYIGTGFHGLHVLIGTIFLSVHLLLTYFNNIYNITIRIGLEIAIWYWHFVDVIWLLLYLLIYFLPS
jgi:cytochrome c oxidase subunit 3